MPNRRRLVSILIGVIILAGIAGVFIFPKYYGAQFRQWRLGLDLVGGSHLVYEVDMSNVGSGDRELVLGGLRDVIEKRVNLFGVAEPQVLVAKKGDAYRLIVELAGVKDVTSAIKDIGETPFLLFAEVTKKESSEKDENGKLKQIDAFIPSKLSGRHIKSAQLNFDNLIGKPEVLLAFNDEGAKLFEDLTEKNIGNRIAIFLDGQLIQAPVVQQKITGGRAQITGDFTVQEAKQLVERFNAGALPAPIALVSQSTVGASLGADSLQKTVWAGLLGTLATMLFMLGYYRGLGLCASVALCIYIVLTLGVFKLSGITMTLSGIAGFILSIGMAVDANVLIFERHKEEVKRGVSRVGALSEAFARAWPSIRDSNISTMITAIILYYTTTGFVRGFSLTLFIGVIMSMFSAITVTRAMLGTFLRDKKEGPLL